MAAIPLDSLPSGQPMTPRIGGGPSRPSDEQDPLVSVSTRGSEEDDGPDADDEEIDGFIAAHDTPPPAKHARLRLFLSFLTFGLLNNVLYVIILSAALDLVPATTPKGVVAFFNVAPALVAKVFWPLISVGKVRYGRRIAFCTCCSWLGIVIIALSAGVYPRLFGISLASLSSGLGELTFLQLTTTLPTRSASKTALGAWSSGTGAAGIAGAGLWWLLRGLGVKAGLGLSSLLPLFFPVTYLVLLPPFTQLADPALSNAYQPIPTNPIPEAITPPTLTISLPPSESGREGKKVSVRLSTADKVRLLRPLVVRYMVPLCAVYVEEYIINSGVAPTLVFPLPTQGIWSHFFKSPRDYYPFWSLTYQTFVFLSRSALSLGLPPIPLPFLPLPSIIQFLLLTLLTLQSRYFIFTSPAYTPPSPPPSTGADRTISVVFFLMCLEGLCGGSAYVNTFYHVGREGEDGERGEEGEEGVRQGMEREFRVGAVGAADSTGILVASLISMPMELWLCSSQVAQGRTTCRDL